MLISAFCIAAGIGDVMCLAGAPVCGRSTGPQAHELAAAFLLLPPSCLTVLPSASGWTGRGRRGKGCAFQSCAGGDRWQVAYAPAESGCYRGHGPRPCNQSSAARPEKWAHRDCARHPPHDSMSIFAASGAIGTCGLVAMTSA